MQAVKGGFLPSLVIAGTTLGLMIIWILSGLISGDTRSTIAPADRTEKAHSIVQQVRVRTIVAETPVTTINISGQTHTNRSVVVKAATAGQVAEVLVEKGEWVAPGQLLVRLKEEERPARLAEARALVHRREVEYEAAKALEQKAFASRIRLAEAQATLNAARAQLAHVQVDLDRTRLRAPFAGVVESCPVAIGDFIVVGGTIATVVDMKKVVVAAAVTERDVAMITPGSVAETVLSNGQRLAGLVSYISKVANTSTRTFPVELSIANDTGTVLVGLTAELYLPRQRRSLHAIPPSALTFDDKTGHVGIKAVTSSSSALVTFFPVSIVTSATNGMLWVAGAALCIPPVVHLIVVGQEFVTVGQQVQAVPEAALESGSPG